ncbi:hypothetical protein [Pantoea stewartii]|uniref:hypothetical protein n=1 Tax=Pantoea stewartii TaxID=66269 RepID=UPI0012482F20|nr:hypothetical protein [Pantoea stewartii]KAB0556200.1 hypothetical protein F7Q90_08460 [Pantoea stewartii subsp. stewartii]
MHQLTASEASDDEMERQSFHLWAINQCEYDMSFNDETKRTYRSMKTRKALKVWQAALKSKQGEV